MEDLASLFKALSDETRLKIMVLLLWERELCVCDVERVLGITQSRSSRHLRYLLNAGLVSNRRVGAWMHYHVPRELSQEHQQVVRLLRRVFSERDLSKLRASLNSWLRDKTARGESC